MSGLALVRPSPEGDDGAWPRGEGELARMVRERPWRDTPLGASARWDPALRAAVDLVLASPAPMTLLVGSTGVSIHNDAYAAFIGDAHPRALGASVFDTWPDYADFNRHVLATTLAGGALSLRERWLDLARAGRTERVWMDLDYSPVRDAAGRPLGALAIIKDITPRVRADRALTEARDRSKGVLDGMGEAFALIDRDFRVIDVNAMTLRLGGRARDEVVGRSWWEVTPSEDKAELLPLYQRALAQGRPVEFEHAPSGDHAGRVLDVRAYPVADGLAVFYRDVTRRKRAEAELAESEARFRHLADSAPVMMWVGDIGGGCTYLNRRWYEFTGQPPGGGEGEGWLAAVHPDDRAMARAAFARAGAERREYRVELRLRRADGVYRWTLSAAAPRVAADGAALGFVGSVIDIDERREAERALEAERARAEALAAERAAVLGQLGEGVIVTDPAGAITFVNEAAARISGVARLGVTPEDYTEVYQLLTEAGDPYPPLDLPLARAVRGETVTDARWRIRRPGGDEVLAIGSARPVLDPATGGQIGAVLTIRDDTAREAAERARRDSEARFQAIVDSIAQMVWSTDADGLTDFYNQRWYDFTGVPKGATDGLAWATVFHPDDQARARATWARAVATGELYEIEYRLRHHSGQYRWVLGRGTAVRDETGRIRRWFGTCTDIDDLVAAREVLARSRDELERLVDERTAERDRAWRYSRDLQVVVDGDGTFVSPNEAWRSILGWEPGEVLGRHYLDFIHPDDVALSTAARAVVTAAPLPVFESRYQHRDGSYRTISWVAAPHEGRVYASGRDVTAERAREAELAGAQEALRQAQKMEAVGQLTGGIAHDFNNMLAIVIGALDMLGRRLPEGDARARRYVDAAAEGAGRAAALTRRLLAFSRRQPLKPEAVDANALVAGMSDLLVRALGGAVTVETALAPDLWRTHADPNQLESALLNLAVNARDAMPGGGRVTIATSNARLDAAYAAANPGAKSGDYVAVSVADSGCGMSADVLAKAFDPFFTTKEVGKGTGLGLSQVYGFVKQSGGHVWLRSAPGAGTTVTIHLPRLTTAADAAAARAPAPPPAPARGGRELVLVVEDEPAVRRLAVEALEELGYRALDADGAGAALPILEAQPAIGLLLTDVVMPEMSGPALAREARRRRPELPVLFITGYAREAAMHGGELGGDAPILGKPFTVDELGAAVRRVLDRAA